MSQQSFSNAFRDAFWRVFGKKCLYCGGELLFRAMHIDHVIPERLESDASAKATILASIGLPADFNLLSNDNLAPSCFVCNTQKGDLLLPDGSISIHLAKIKAKKSALENALKEQKAERTLDSILREIARSIDGGVFTRDDLMERLKDDRVSRWVPNFPSAPTVSQLNVELRSDDPATIALSSHARRMLESRGVPLDSLVSILTSNVLRVRATEKNAERVSAGRIYQVAAENLRILFKILEDRVVVTSISFA